MCFRTIKVRDIKVQIRPIGLPAKISKNKLKTEIYAIVTCILICRMDKKEIEHVVQCWCHVLNLMVNAAMTPERQTIELT